MSTAAAVALRIGNHVLGYEQISIRLSPVGYSQTQLMFILYRDKISIVRIARNIFNLFLLQCILIIIF